MLAREEEPALPFVPGGFGTILADPPWEYSSGKASRIRPKYHTMPIEEIGNLPVESLAAESALLFLWTTPTFTEHAYWVCRRWGFVPKAQSIWVKGRLTTNPSKLLLQIGMGSYVRNAHELIIIGSRGGATGLERDVPSVFVAERGKHSAKPEVAYEHAERLGPGPRLELFARAARPGWVSWGNEVAT